MGASTEVTVLLASLTAAQCEAVEHRDGPLLILAGPGSGKTRVITHRVARLLQQGIPARHILALTFTNKAAEEMRQRIDRLAPQQPVWISTFHRFCARLLRRYASHVGLDENFAIYDTDDSRQALKQTIEGLQTDVAMTRPERIARAISNCKNHLVTAEQYSTGSGGPLRPIIAEIYPAYQQRLLTSNAVDFDDLLLHVATMLRQHQELRATLDESFRYVLVDEYQDTNLAQYAIVRALSVDHPNLAVTGDPDQSIYGWRGANLNNILDFEQDYPNVRVVRLEQNYRSTQRIVQVADVLIANNLQRKPKSLFTENDPGRRVRLVSYGTHQQEAEHIAAVISRQVQSGQRRPRDFAIFYRINALSRWLEHALREHGLPYQIVRGVEFYQRKEIKDVVAYLRLINNARDDVAFLRIINTPPRGIGRTTLQRLTGYARQCNLSLLEAARQCHSIDKLARQTTKKIDRFVSLYDPLAGVATAPVEEVLGTVLILTGYREALAKSGTPEDQERLANVEELLTAAREFDEMHPGECPLEEFLEQTALVNDTDDWRQQSDLVTLMTLHAAKGLEFPVVFIVAVEHGLLPHQLSRDDPARLEEERRLLFVGITRAQQELHLSQAQYRAFRGERSRTVPSEFLMELPREEMEVVQSGAAPVPDDDWDYSQFEHTFEPAPAKKPRRASAVQLSTAAEMLGEPTATGPSSEVSLNVFRLGTPVMHPTYGLGKVVALSGSRSKRTATVNFVNGSGPKKFVIAKSPLRPVG